MSSEGIIIIGLGGALFGAVVFLLITWRTGVIALRKSYADLLAKYNALSLRYDAMNVRGDDLRRMYDAQEVATHTTQEAAAAQRERMAGLQLKAEAFERDNIGSRKAIITMAEEMTAMAGRIQRLEQDLAYANNALARLQGEMSRSDK